MPPCAELLPYMVKRTRKRSRARGRRGGRPQRRSAQAAARRWARAPQHVRDVRSRCLVWRPVRRVILGTQARLIFAQPCAEQEARALLQAAAIDLAACLWSSPEQAMLHDGNPDVKVPGQRHHCRHRYHCRHRWRILVEGEGGGVVCLSLSPHHREGGVGLPGIWVQGMRAVVWRVAGFFCP